MFPELVKLLVQILLIAGALNWGAISLVGTDLVKSVVGSGQPDRIIKIVVGVAGAIAGMEFLKAQMKSVSMPSFMPAPLPAPTPVETSQ